MASSWGPVWRGSSAQGKLVSWRWQMPKKGTQKHRMLPKAWAWKWQKQLVPPTFHWPKQVTEPSPGVGEIHPSFYRSSYKVTSRPSMDTRRGEELKAIIQSHTRGSVRECLAARRKRPEKRAPWEDPPSWGSWGDPTGRHWRNKCLDLPRSPAQFSHLLDPAGSQEAKEPSDGVQTGPPPRAGSSVGKSDSESGGTKRGSGPSTGQLLEKNKAKKLSTQTNPHLPPVQARKMGNLRVQKLWESLNGLHCHVGIWARGMGRHQALREIFFFPQGRDTAGGGNRQLRLIVWLSNKIRLWQLMIVKGSPGQAISGGKRLEGTRALEADETWFYF